ncbi:hypothetical protein POM88_007264 [Heracleum sosnowskyi]|uniref:Uncharacterized protein n=1 Tax=Heracleum sosnowskyi TaxID=360622 RepID=A0AAD8J544_9APIA|nr:hypothetical protein POM88_007264 [Heracleum sosnowskyi]
MNPIIFPLVDIYLHQCHSTLQVAFVDEEASQIMLIVWNNQKEDYFPLLKEAYQPSFGPHNFIEVIGMVREIGALEPASNGAKKLDVLLVDGRQVQMIVTL